MSNSCKKLQCVPGAANLAKHQVTKNGGTGIFQYMSDIKHYAGMAAVGAIFSHCKYHCNDACHTIITYGYSDDSQLHTE